MGLLPLTRPTPSQLTLLLTPSPTTTPPCHTTSATKWSMTTPTTSSATRRAATVKSFPDLTTWLCPMAVSRPSPTPDDYNGYVAKVTYTGEAKYPAYKAAAYP